MVVMERMMKLEKRMEKNTSFWLVRSPMRNLRVICDKQTQTTGNNAKAI